MPNYLFRQDTVLNKVGSHFDPGASFTVTVYRPGAVCTLFNSGAATVTVAPGHGFAVGDVMMVGLTAVYRVLTGVTATTLSWSSGTSISQGTKLVNLGPDPLPGGVPAWTASTATIYSYPGSSAITAASVVSSAKGEYEFYRTPDELWELTRNSAGVPVHLGIVPGQEVVVVLYPTAGLNQQNDINNAVAEVFAAGGGVVQLGPGTFRVSDKISLKSGVWLRGQGAATVIQAATTLPQTGGVADGFVVTDASYSEGSRASYIRVSDLLIDFNGQSVYAMSQIVYTDDVVFENVIGLGGSLGAGITVENGRRVRVDGCTFKGFGEFNANVVQINGDVALSDNFEGRNFIVTNCTFDTCIAFGVLMKHMDVAQITNNSFYSCKYPIALESTYTPTANNAVRNLLISGNVATGVAAGVYNAIGIWMYLAHQTQTTDLATIHYPIQITNNIFKGYQVFLKGLASHCRVAGNLIYDYGHTNGESAMIVGTYAPGTYGVCSNWLIEDNYFTQVSARQTSGIHGAIEFVNNNIGPVNNVVIRKNWFNGQDSAASPGDIQHALYIEDPGSGWCIQDNIFRGITDWPIRIGTHGGGTAYAAPGFRIIGNQFVDCNSARATPTTWITFGVSIACARVIVKDNVATAASGGGLTYLFSDNNVAGSSFYADGNVARDATSGLIFTNNGSLWAGEDVVVTRPLASQIATYEGDIGTYEGEVAWY